MTVELNRSTMARFQHSTSPGYKRWSLETPCEQEYEKSHDVLPFLTTLGLFILILTNLMH